MDGIHGVLNVWFVTDGEPSLQRHLAVIAGLAAVDDDRIVVRCAGQRHLKFIHHPVVAGDRGYGQAVSRCQSDGQLAEPGSVEILVIILLAGEISIVRRMSSDVPLSSRMFMVIMPYFPL
jgi:hypothetical protein